MPFESKKDDFEYKKKLDKMSTGENIFIPKKYSLFCAEPHCTVSTVDCSIAATHLEILWKNVNKHWFSIDSKVSIVYMCQYTQALGLKKPSHDANGKNERNKQTCIKMWKQQTKEKRANTFKVNLLKLWK